MRPLRAAALVLAAAAAVAGEVPDEWVSTASRLQALLSLDVPLHERAVVGTHNSYNSEGGGASPSVEQPKQQVFGLVTQLEALDVRLLELDPHFVESANFVTDDDAERVRVCHASVDVSSIVRDVCRGLIPVGGVTMSFAECAALGVRDLGADTYCTADTAKTLRDALGEVAEWLRLRPAETLLLYVDHFMDSRHDLLDAALLAAFGDGILRPGDALAPAAPGDAWPSARQMLAAGKRVVVFSRAARTDRAGAGELMWDHAQYRRQGAADRLDAAACTAGGGVTRDSLYFSHVKGDAAKVLIQGQTLYDGTEDGENVLDFDKTRAAARCGMTVSLDRVNASLLEASLWSFADEDDLPVGAAGCVRYSGAASGLVLRAGNCGDAHPHACRDTGGNWSLASTNGAHAGETGGGAAGCPDGFEFAAPRGPADMDAIRAADAAAGSLSPWVAIEATGDPGCWRLGAAAELHCSAPATAEGLANITGLVERAVYGGDGDGDGGDGDGGGGGGDDGVVLGLSAAVLAAGGAAAVALVATACVCARRRRRAQAAGGDGTPAVRLSEKDAFSARMTTLEYA